MVQWLGLGALTAVARVQSQVRKLNPASCAAWPKKKKKKKVIADGTATTQNNTNDREIKNQPEETFKVLRQRTEIFLKNRQ